MKVIIWRAHGYTSVYSADTAYQIKKVILAIIANLQYFDLDDKIELVQRHMEKHPNDRTEMLKCFNKLKNAVSGEWDAFDELSLSDLIEECT